MEAKDPDLEIEEEEQDLFAEDIHRTFVDIHETFHAAEVRSRMINRDAAGFVATFICDEVLKCIQKDTLNAEIPFSRPKGLLEKGQTWKEHWLEAIDIYSAQYLGKGKLAEKLREVGIYEGLWSAGIEFHAGFKFDSVKHLLPIENSITASYMSKLKTAIEKEDKSLLQRLNIEIKEHSDGMLTLLETLTESFALAGVQQYIMNIPDKRLGQARRKKYYKQLYADTIRRGVIAQQYFDIVDNNKHPATVKRLLEEKGMKYKHVIARQKEELHVKTNLVNLGFPYLDPYSAYSSDMFPAIRSGYTEHDSEDILLPMNHAKALFDYRYSSCIPAMMKVIRKYGVKDAYSKLLKVESIEQVNRLAKGGK
jgi:hypothetical protein